MKHRILVSVLAVFADGSWAQGDLLACVDPDVREGLLFRTTESGTVPSRTVPDDLAGLPDAEELEFIGSSVSSFLTVAAAVVSALVERGADANGRDMFGFTPIHMASGTAGNQSVIAALLDAGAHIRARTDGGDSVLHVAALVNDPANVQLLLEAGAEVDARDRHGWTPLHKAAFHYRCGGVVEMLINAGAVSRPDRVARQIGSGTAQAHRCARASRGHAGRARADSPRSG